MLRQDFKHRVDHRPSKGHWRLRYTLLAAGLGIIGAVLASTSPPNNNESGARPADNPRMAADHIEKAATTARSHLTLKLPAYHEGGVVLPASTPPPRPEASSEHTIHKIVRPGDTLSAILQKVGVGTALGGLLQADKHMNQLNQLASGQTLDLIIADGQLQQLDIQNGMTSITRFEREDGIYHVSLIERSYERRQVQAHAVIKDSLYVDARKAGLSDAQIMALADIFAWDIDFAQDIRPGDHFTVVYDVFYDHGEKVGNGQIVAAEFATQGHYYKAIRFTHDGRDDYYTPEGRSLRKAFLRTPVKFTRISSRFGLRKHPILNRMRAHKGVDYAAPMGTPIRASGDGKAIFVGWKGGYGRVIILQHGHRYSTVYGHLSRFAHGLKPGNRVRQGAVIGYVGRSGLATGPHLHYEFRVNGVHRNPLTVALPAAAPLPDRYWASFKARSTPLLAMMTEYSRTALALNSRQP